MSITNKLKNLLVHPDVKYVIETIDSDEYDKLSFNEKADLLIAFNDALNAVLDHGIILYVNKKPSKEYEARTVSANMEEARFVINGVENNPYACLRDLLLMQLSYDDIENYDYIQIGEVRYDENFVYEFPQLGFYNKDNIKYLRAANKFVNELIVNSNNPYKKDFEKDFDNNLTNKAIEEIQAGYEAMDSCLKRGVYEELDAFSNMIGEMVIKDKLSVEELALLSLDEVLYSYVRGDALLEEHPEEDVVSNAHYRQFIECFFKEYAEYINIDFDDLGININDREVIEDELFMDVLMQEIEAIENNHHLIDSIVSDEILARFNKKMNKNYTKLDCYFYSKLDILDSYLKDKKLEIINYNKWTNIYRDDKKESIFEDKRELFADLLENEEFISTIESYLHDKKAGDKELLKIMNMMNDSYGANFKLIINNQAQLENCMGIADDMGCIYINAENIREKVSTLITLFHEYRHLIQSNECDNNSDLFNDNIYEYVKMENEHSLCGNEYNYAEMSRFGYINDKFYGMQPTEYDAELFAEKFMKKIQKKMKDKKEINYYVYVSDNYRSCKFIDSEKYSIESYNNYLVVNEIPQTKKEEDERYLLLKDQMDKMASKEDAISIIKDPIFTALNMNDKTRVFKMLAEDEFKISYSKSKKMITIDNIKLSTMVASDYEVIASIISIQADRKIAKGELKLSCRNEYICKELGKYKYNFIEEFNCFAPHSYHRCMNKYLRLLSKENKTATKGNSKKK